MKKYIIALLLIGAANSASAQENSELTCASLDTRVYMACPKDIPKYKDSISVIIADLEDMKYRCRQKDCSQIVDINQSLFLLNNAYKKIDIAYEIEFSNIACLKRGVSYIDKIHKKIKACEAAKSNVATFQTIFKP